MADAVSLSPLTPKEVWDRVLARIADRPLGERLVSLRALVLDELARLLHQMHQPCPHAGQSGHLASVVPAPLQARVALALEQYQRLMEDEVAYAAELSAQAAALVEGIERLVSGTAEPAAGPDLADPDSRATVARKSTARR